MYLMTPHDIMQTQILSRSSGDAIDTERASIPKKVSFKPSEWEEVTKFVDPRLPIGTWMHDLIMGVARGQIQISSAPIAGTDQFRAPLLPKVPCGPWGEAQEVNKAFTISAATADELGARDGDLFIEANGDSMKGVGIMDGAIVLIRPYTRSADAKDIALIECGGEDVEPEYTLKRWMGEPSPGKPAVLLDGNGDPFEIPKGRVARPVARVLGVVSRIKY